TFRPYMFFSAITPKALQTVSSLSATSSNRKPCLARKLEWVFAESRETPRISAPSAWNSGSSASKSRPSVVQPGVWSFRSEEHTSELQSRENLVCRLLLEKK